MKKVVLSVIMGLCCTLCMAQSFDSEWLKQKWYHLSTYCRAQYEIACLDSIQHQLKDKAKEKEDIENTLRALRSVTLKNYNKTLLDISNCLSTHDLTKKNPATGSIYHYYASIAHNNPQDIEVLVDPKVNYPQVDSLRRTLMSDIATFYAQDYQSNAPQEAEFPFSLSPVEMVCMACVLVLLILLIVVSVILGILNKRMKHLADKMSRYENSMSYQRSKTLSSATAPSISPREFSDLKDRLSRVESALASIAIDKNKEALAANTSPRPSAVSTPQPTSTNADSYVFLRNFKDGIMKECSENEAQYRLILLNAQVASGEFTFVGNVGTAIATKDATFEYVCELSNWTSSAKSCTTIEKGQAEKVSGGKWKVTKKATIQFS